METIRETHHPDKKPASASQASNDNRRNRLSFKRSEFSEDAVARIFRPSRSAMTSGKARTKSWRLVFEHRRAPFIEPLMGYTGSTDPLAQVKLEFPTLRSAIRYAERQGLTYVVQRPASKAVALAKKGIRRRVDRPSCAFSDATLERLGLAALQASYGMAMDKAIERNDTADPATGSSPMDVVRDPTLPLGAKRSVLMNWAWTEYLIDQSTNEDVPENSRPSLLHAVEQALLALEREVQSGLDRSTADREAA
ncbi:ETC complex I subunit [Rhizobium leguminosarum]|uniref:ETC complex I subunit n=1 Tax=Rhizobium leguminosarum TaxID=384 RepID=UPI003D046BFF